MSLPLPDVFDVPLFPLPGTVLFPGMVIPLHIFEPRYRRLLGKALAGEKRIALGNLVEDLAAPGKEPSVHEVLGVGRIAAHQTLLDGASNIALVGLARCRIQAEPVSKPFRVVTVSTLRDTVPAGAEEQRTAREVLVDTAVFLMRRMVKTETLEILLKTLEEREAIGQAADFLAGLFIQESGLKQQLLEMLDVMERARQVQEILRRYADGLDPQPPPLTGRLDDFSLN